MYALVQNNTIVNVVACDEAFASTHGLMEVTQIPQPGIGWTLNDGEWTAPTPPPAPGPTSGAVQLVNGAATVESNQITAASIVMLTPQSTAITGNLSAVAAAGSCAVASTRAADAGMVGWALQGS